MGREERREAIKERLDEKLTSEQKENLGAVAKIAENNKGNFFHSISFQKGLVTHSFWWHLLFMQWFRIRQ